MKMTEIVDKNQKKYIIPPFLSRATEGLAQ
jgi:hypothetical protein